MNSSPCSTCPFQRQCADVFGHEDIPLLAPFNPILVQRIFNNLPDGKGKARQFLRVIREILLSAMSTGQMETALDGHARLDMAAESPDKRLSSLVECYFPPVKELEQHKVELNFLSAFNLNIEPVFVELQPLGRLIGNEPTSLPHPTWFEDGNSLVVKDWLDGKPVNRQSMQSLRRGTARWIRDFMSIGYFHRPNKPRPHRILRWNGIYMDVRPPVLLEGVDDDRGIYLSPKIGILAFHLCEYALANGKRRVALAGLIASNLYAQEIIHHARCFQENLEAIITTQLGRTPAHFAAEVTAIFRMLGDAPQMESNPLLNQLPVITSVTYQAQASFKVLEYARLLFEDFYMLREQLYDYAGFHQTLAGRTLDEFAQNLLNLDITRISPEFEIGNILLSEYISKVQQRIKVWQNPLLSSDLGYVHSILIRSFDEYGQIGLPFSSIPSDIWGKMKIENPDVFHRLRIYLDSGDSLRTS